LELSGTGRASEEILELTLSDATDRVGVGSIVLLVGAGGVAGGVAVDIEGGGDEDAVVCGGAAAGTLRKSARMFARRDTPAFRSVRPCSERAKKRSAAITANRTRKIPMGMTLLPFSAP
jgi:hypothetical protein